MADCPLCGATGSLAPLIADAPDRMQGTPARASVQRCAACGGGVTFPRVGPQELAAFYPSSYAPYVPAGGPVAVLSALVQRLLSWQAKRTAPLNALAGRAPGHALEIGAGRGDLAVMLMREG